MLKVPNLFIQVLFNHLLLKASGHFSLIIWLKKINSLFTLVLDFRIMFVEQRVFELYSHVLLKCFVALLQHYIRTHHQLAQF